jgi:aldose sugar dehydrogenase
VQQLQHAHGTNFQPHPITCPMYELVRLWIHSPLAERPALLGFEVDHWARGGDEINVLRAGANYGWPLVTFGIDYSGDTISLETAQSGLASPKFYWVPSIAPSGMDFYTGDRFPEWRGDLFVGALAARALYRLDIADGQIVGQEILLAEHKERIREVKTGPDGLLYVLTDAAHGKLLRLEPLESP